MTASSIDNEEILVHCTQRSQYALDAGVAPFRDHLHAKSARRRRVRFEDELNDEDASPKTCHGAIEDNLRHGRYLAQENAAIITGNNSLQRRDPAPPQGQRSQLNIGGIDRVFGEDHCQYLYQHQHQNYRHMPYDPSSATIADIYDYAWKRHLSINTYVSKVRSRCGLARAS
jgi:hypothetical protein